MDALTEAFLQESTELLTQFEDELLLLEKTPSDANVINSLFRCAHTVKGGAGIVKCEFMVGFAHIMENLLDEVRSGKVVVTPDLIATLLHSKDHLESLLSLFAAGKTTLDAELSATGEQLVVQLKSYLGVVIEKVALASAVPIVTSVEAIAGASEESVSSSACWHISVRFGRDVLRKGMDPLSFLHYLTNLGEIVHLVTLYDALPSIDEIDVESCYLGFEISLNTRKSKRDIEQVFDFVRDDCQLHILPPAAKIEDYIQLIHDLPEGLMRIGEILVSSGALTTEELAGGLRLQASADAVESINGVTVAAAPKPLGEILVDQQMVQRELVGAAVAKQARVSEKKIQENKFIRVSAEKLDVLIDLVGELVIAGATGSVMAKRCGDSKVMEACSLITDLVEDIRDNALQLRMVQIGETFNRFQRVVRDMSGELGKDIELVITGGETELDKTVVEKIGDPLMHLVRNSIDHGIETEQVRLAKGKSARGRLSFNAHHESGSIVIEVSDDGAGLNRERILKKAIERGLVDAEQHLSDADINRLIFEAGFSTADAVTSLSGRGVGMDVVRRNIESLRGTVEVESVAGQGTTFRIRLPLTLAIIDGFLVSVGDAFYILPLDAVVECMEINDAALCNRRYLNLRGEVLPFVRLRDLFGIKQTRGKRQNIMVVQHANNKIGLVVDELQGEFQTVIKPLGPLFAHLKGVSGTTVLGSGEVALILDVQTLVNIAAESDQHASAVLMCGNG